MLFVSGSVNMSNDIDVVYVVMMILMWGCGELCIYFFFFFQAEDGIRDWSVTGVQTCALPISQVLNNMTVTCYDLPRTGENDS